MRTTQQVQKTTNKEAGVTLMELIAALAVMAVIIVGALSLYNSATSSQASTQLVQDVMALRAGIKQLWMGQGDYTGLKNDTLVASGKVPGTIKTDTSKDPDTLTHTGGGTIVIGPNATTTQFDITINGLTKSSCIALASSLKDWIDVKINTKTETLPVTPGAAATDCNVDSNTILFTGN